MNKKLLSVIILICMIAACCVFTACEPAATDKAASFVSVGINPSLELTLDGNNKVLSVRGANEDGQVLLYGEASLVGLDVEEAVAKITSLAVELGYLNENNAVVETSVTSSKAGAENAILNKVNAKITATAESLNLNVSCSSELAYSLARKLEQIKAAHPDSEAIKSLTPQKLKLVLAVSENGEVSLEAAAQMDTAQLIAKASEISQKTEEFATDAYNKLKTSAFDAYDSLVGASLDSVYTLFYANPANLLKHASTAYYGVLYQSYKTAARGLNVMADGLFYLEKLGEQELNEEQIAAMAESLGLGSDVSALEDNGGKITLNSIYAYADKTFKNSKTAAEIEEIKNKLDVALTEVEREIQKVIDEAALEYQPQIEKITKAYGEMVEKVKTAVDALPEAIKNQAKAMLDECAKTVNQLSDILSDGKITSDEIRNVANKCDEQAAAVLKDIEESLSEEELAQIDESKQKMIDGFASAKKEMEAKLAKAEEDARAELDAYKQALKKASSL